MPDFATAKNVIGFEKNLSKSELARAIRFSISAEYEAVQIYQQIMEATDDTKVIKVINDIIEEERLHAGQFLDLLVSIDPKEKEAYDKGSEENRKI